MFRINLVTRTPRNIHVCLLSSTDLILQTFHVKTKSDKSYNLVTFSTQDVSRIDNLINNNNSQADIVKRSKLFCIDHERFERRYTNDIISINFQQCYNRILLRKNMTPSQPIIPELLRISIWPRDSLV